ncbi:MAG: hypothetical protein ABSE16_03855 [Verrucomicrobiota bacterium]|jgi:hypothetical protein
MQKIRNLLKLMMGAALIVVTGTGCGTLTISQYTAGPSKQAKTTEAQGLKVTVDPVCDRERADAYFKVNPTGKGVAIIYLQAANQSPDATWLLSEANMFLAVPGQAGELNANDQGVKGDYGVSTGLEAAATPFMLFPGPDLFVGVPLLLSGSKAARDASVVQKNFVDKEWHNQTLSPGQQAQGFIYFNWKEQSPSASAATLRMDCIDVRSQQTNTLTFPLNYETK